MKNIPLTQGRVAVVDEEDFPILNQYKWQLARCNGYLYARRGKRANGRRIYIYMHRQIIGAHPDAKVDHWSGDGLDNRRSNLRVCTNQENLCNSKIRTNNKSGYKGVLWVASLRKWRAKIMHFGRQIHLGYFPTAVDAARAYNQSALMYYGTFARLNSIPN